MSLDAVTLSIVGILVNLLLGGLLLFSWNSNRVNRELLFLGVCFCGAAFGGLLMGNTAGSALPQFKDLGYSMLFFAYGAAWQAARVFEKRPLLVAYAAAGGVIWLLLVVLTDCENILWVRAVAISGVPVVYCALAVRELWRGRQEYLPSRKALCFVLLVDNALFVIRGLLIILSTSSATEGNDRISLLTLIAITANIAIAYLVLSLIKERLEAEQTAQTMVDPLTGLGNRRAVTAYAERMLRRQAESGEPACVAIIDLDHFKKINDTYGHFIGDDVLRVFAERASMRLRSTDYLFRIGGEEFLCILQAAYEEDAVHIMERVRGCMKGYLTGEDANAPEVTISAGIASVTAAGYDLTDLTRAADSALYEAKRAGRNCVRVFQGAGTARLVAE